MNHNFATVDSSNRILYAPDTLGRSLRPPSAWQYNTANYWKLDNTVPEAPEGKYAVVSMLGGAELGEIVTIQEEHVPELDENGEPIDPNDEYKPLIKVVRKWYEFKPLPAPPPPTVDDYNRAVEDHLMAERMERGYDTREPSLYINSSIPRWHQDAQDWISHVDSVMSFALSILNGWKETGEVMSLDEFKLAIPRIQWTEA